jgi:hypothetical protein
MIIEWSWLQCVASYVLADDKDNKGLKQISQRLCEFNSGITRNEDFLCWNYADYADYAMTSLCWVCENYAKL